MHRSHLLQSPLQPGGSPRWPVTDAHDCCPWLECSASLQIKKIKLSFQSYPKHPSSPTCPSMIFFTPHNLFSIIFSHSCVSACMYAVLPLLKFCLAYIKIAQCLSSHIPFKISQHPLLSSPLLYCPVLSCPVLFFFFIMELNAFQGVLAQWDILFYP